MDDFDQFFGEGMFVELSNHLVTVSDQNDFLFEIICCPDGGFDRGMNRDIPAHGVHGNHHTDLQASGGKVIRINNLLFQQPEHP